MITAAECRQLIDEAIKTYGTYVFEDKGPEEVMDIPAIEARMSDMTAEQVADVLAEVSKNSEAGESFTSTMMVVLQERENFDALYEDKRLAGLF